MFCTDKSWSFRNFKKLLPAVLLGICCNTYAANDLIPSLMEEGMKNYSAKKYGAASDYLGQVVDMDSEHYQARYYLIYSLSLSGNNELALKHAKVLTQKFPKEKQYKTLYNQINAEINRQASKKRHQETSSGKIQKEVMFGGYQSLDKNAEMRKPKEDYAPRGITPQKPLTELEKAIRKVDEEDYDTAEKMLKELVKKEPKNHEVHHNLGVLEFSRGKYKEAINYFKKSLEHKPDYFQSQFLMADCYRNLEDSKNAEKALKKAVEIKYDEFALINLADTEIKLGKFKEAEEIYEKILAKSPNSSEASVGLAQIRISQGKINEAMGMVNKAISTGGSSDANYVKALILLTSRMYQEALEQIDIALKASPGNNKYIVTRALINVKSMNFSQGLDEANSVLSANPDSIAARLVIAEAFLSTSADSEAEAQLDEIDRKGVFSESHKLRGLLEKKKGNDAEAKNQYKKYFEISGALPVSSYEYAEFLESLGAKDEAIELYRDIVKQYPDSIYAVKSKEALSRLENNRDSSSDTFGDDSSFSNSHSDPNVRSGKVRY